MSTCNLSNFSSIWFKHTSSHWFPHRSPSTIIYQQVHDIPSYNIRSSPLWGRSGLQDLQSQWVLNLQQLGPGPGLLWGGAKKRLLVIANSTSIFLFFGAPPPSPLEVAQVLEIVEIMDFIIANSTTISYIPLVCLKTQLSVPASTCIYCRLYVVRVDTYIVWFQWWSVEECLDLMA